MRSDRQAERHVVIGRDGSIFLSRPCHGNRKCSASAKPTISAREWSSLSARAQASFRLGSRQPGGRLRSPNLDARVVPVDVLPLQTADLAGAQTAVEGECRRHVGEDPFGLRSRGLEQTLLVVVRECLADGWLRVLQRAVSSWRRYQSRAWRRTCLRTDSSPLTVFGARPASSALANDAPSWPSSRLLCGHVIVRLAPTIAPNGARGSDVKVALPACQRGARSARNLDVAEHARTIDGRSERCHHLIRPS